MNVKNKCINTVLTKFDEYGIQINIQLCHIREKVNSDFVRCKRSVKKFFKELKTIILDNNLDNPLTLIYKTIIEQACDKNILYSEPGFITEDLKEGPGLEKPYQYSQRLQYGTNDKVSIRNAQRFMSNVCVRYLLSIFIYPVLFASDVEPSVYTSRVLKGENNNTSVLGVAGHDAIQSGNVFLEHKSDPTYTANVVTNEMFAYALRESEMILSRLGYSLFHLSYQRMPLYFPVIEESLIHRKGIRDGSTASSSQHNSS